MTRKTALAEQDTQIGCTIEKVGHGTGKRFYPRTGTSRGR